MQKLELISFAIGAWCASLLFLCVQAQCDNKSVPWPECLNMYVALNMSSKKGLMQGVIKMHLPIQIYTCLHNLWGCFDVVPRGRWRLSYFRTFYSPSLIHNSICGVIIRYRGRSLLQLSTSIRNDFPHAGRLSIFLLAPNIPQSVPRVGDFHDIELLQPIIILDYRNTTNTLQIKME